MAELKRQVEEQEHRLKRAKEDQQEVFKDQKRIRDNLYRIPRNTDLHRRYLTKLNTQENKLERTLKEIEAAKKDVDRTKKALTDYIGKLKL
jgi:chromosome segregation ATPase